MARSWPSERRAGHRAGWARPAERYCRGYGSIFARHAGSADKGCDFDFLEPGFGPAPGEPEIF